ncbi:MAG: hypothetical protein GX325_04870 [Peptococcaceae bacterium]|nr:hypothetical protein [Peptococcaceae bacterium]
MSTRVNKSWPYVLFSRREASVAMPAIPIKERLLTGGRFWPIAVAWFLFFILLVFLAGRYYMVINGGIYPTLHMIIEFLIVAVALCAALMSWYDYKYKRELKMLLLSLTFCLVAPLEFAHALSYMGMPDFITPNTVDKASTLFTITKLILAVGLLGAVVFGERIVVIRKSALIPIVSLFLSAGLIYLLVRYMAILPAMYDPATGSQTVAKIFLGYLVIGLEAVTLLRIIAKKWVKNQDLYLGMALMLIIMSDLAFTYYSSPYDTYNLLGHVFQAFSFAFVFKAIIEDAVGMLHETNRTLTRQSEMLAEKNRQMLEADRLKDEFLANTNHELRTPLAAIIAFTEILLDDSPNTLSEQQRDYLEEINDSSRELLERINGFLDLSKIAAGKTILHMEELNIYELIDELAHNTKPLFGQKGIDLMIPRADTQVKVWGDRGKIKQILTNLFSNALKFTAPGGQVTVRVRQDDSAGVYISVTDTGIGISAVDQEKIFQPFQQVDGTSARKYSGVGIGLALAKKLVDLHGGNIRVTSEKDKGSTFTFVLPKREN